jgi:hypothetical protein
LEEPRAHEPTLPYTPYNPVIANCSRNVTPIGFYCPSPTQGGKAATRCGEKASPQAWAQSCITERNEVQPEPRLHNGSPCPPGYLPNGSPGPRAQRAPTSKSLASDRRHLNASFGSRHSTDRSAGEPAPVHLSYQTKYKEEPRAHEPTLPYTPSESGARNSIMLRSSRLKAVFAQVGLVLRPIDYDRPLIVQARHKTKTSCTTNRRPSDNKICPEAS